MKWAVLAARFFVGLVFTLFSVVFFLKVPMDEPPADENALKFIGSLAATDYLFAVKILELLGGILLLSGRLTPLGLVILVPITVNIALYDVLMLKLTAPPAGLILLALEGFLMWAYWPYFAPFFRPKAKPARG